MLSTAPVLNRPMTLILTAGMSLLVVDMYEVLKSANEISQ